MTAMARHSDLAFVLYPYAKSPDQFLPPRRHSVVIVGAGPVGLAAALDLGRQGVQVLVLTTTKASAKARARSVFPSARWKSATGLVRPDR